MKAFSKHITSLRLQSLKTYLMRKNIEFLLGFALIFFACMIVSVLLVLFTNIQPDFAFIYGLVGCLAGLTAKTLVNRNN